MSKISFDGKNEEPSGGFQVYEPGTYTMEVLDFEKGTSSKGNPQMKVSLAIKDADLLGKPYTEWLSLTEQAAWKVKAFFWACGAQLPKVDLDMNGELFMRLCNELKGHELCVELSKGVNPNTAKDRNQSEKFLRTEEPWDLDVNQVQDEIPDFLKK